MILNVWTITAFFMAGVGVVLALVAGVVSIRGVLAIRRNPDPAGLDAFQDRAHLVALVVAVLLGVRLLAWPHFYLLLESYVPELATYGVMCAFGVTRIEPGLVATLQWMKPALFGLVGFWWLLAIADRRAGAPGLLATRMALTIPVAVLALTESGLEIVYLLREKIGTPVTCCTQFLDTDAATLAATASPLGVSWGAASSWSLVVSIAVSLVTAGAAWALARRGRAPGLGLVIALACAGVANLVATQWSWVDAVAPRVLQLPYHHCVYELLTETPALGVAALLAVTGSIGLLWPAGLAVFASRETEAIVSLQRDVWRLAAIAIVSAVLIVTVHLA